MNPIPHSPGEPSVPQAHPRPHGHRLHWSKKTAIVVGVIVVLLVALRLALPSILHSYANKVLDHVGEYHGRIGKVRVHLWRGAYQLQDVRLVKLEGKTRVPFFQTDVLDLSVKWGGLLHGAFVGKVLLKNPRLNFIAASDKGGAQSGIDASWQDQFKKLFPLKFDEVRIENGEIWFHNYDSHPEVHLKLDHVEADATNFTNSHHLSKTLVTTIEMKARAMDAGKLHLTVHSDVFRKPPSFEMKLGLDDLPVTKLNDFLKAYAGVTAASGNFNVYVEMNSNHGQFKGYVKPLIDNLQIFEWEKSTKDPFTFVWEGLVELLSQLLKNQPHDRFATQVPISGSVDDPHFGVIDTLFNVLKNAFVRVFSPGFENLVHPAQAADQAQGKGDQEVKVKVKEPPAPDKSP